MAAKVNRNLDTEVIDFTSISEGDIVVLPDGKHARLRHIVKTPVEVKIPRTQYLTTFDLLDKNGMRTGDHRTVSLLDNAEVTVIERPSATRIGRFFQWLSGKRFA